MYSVLRGQLLKDLGKDLWSMARIKPFIRPIQWFLKALYRNSDAQIPLFLRIEVPLNVRGLTDSANLRIRWAYQAMRMLSAVSWYVCNQVHRAFQAGRAACDVDAGELRHHLLKGAGGFEHLGS